MLVRLFASISGFLFIALAAMFGHAFSPDTSNDLNTVSSICMFVGATALLQGVVFGRAGFASGVLSGCFALVVMSLPLQLYYATSESFTKYVVVLVILFALVGFTNFLGTLLNRRWKS